MAFRLSVLWSWLVLLVVPVRAQTTVAGRVTNLDGGGPLPGVRVALCTPAHGRPVAGSAVQSDALGRFVLADVPPGSWCVQAFYAVQDAGYTLTTPPLEIARDPLVLYVAMPTALDERLRHSLGPTDPNPKSLATITGLLQDGYVTDAEGRVLPGVETRLDAVLAGSLEGRVTRGDRPLPDALLLLDPDRQARSAPDGHFVLRDLRPGSYHLHVVSGPDTLHVPHLDIQPGVNLLDISFRRE